MPPELEEVQVRTGARALPEALTGGSDPDTRETAVTLGTAVSLRNSSTLGRTPLRKTARDGFRLPGLTIESPDTAHVGPFYPNYVRRLDGDQRPLPPARRRPRRLQLVRVRVLHIRSAYLLPAVAWRCLLRHPSNDTPPGKVPNHDRF